MTTLPTLIAELEEALNDFFGGAASDDGSMGHIGYIACCLRDDGDYQPESPREVADDLDALEALMRNFLPTLLAALKRQGEALAEIARHDNTGITGPGRQQADSCVQIARAALKETTDV